MLRLDTKAKSIIIKERLNKLTQMCYNQPRKRKKNRGRVNLKVVSATFVLDYFFSQNESICQTRKNAFYFTSKALSVLEKIKF